MPLFSRSKYQLVHDKLPQNISDEHALVGALQQAMELVHQRYADGIFTTAMHRAALNDCYAKVSEPSATLETIATQITALFHYAMGQKSKELKALLEPIVSLLHYGQKLDLNADRFYLKAHREEAALLAFGQSAVIGGGAIGAHQVFSTVPQSDHMPLMNKLWLQLHEDKFSGENKLTEMRGAFKPTLASISESKKHYDKVTEQAQQERHINYETLAAHASMK